MARRLHLPLLPSRVRWGLVGAVLVAILAFSVVRPPETGVPTRGPFGVFRLSTWLHVVGYVGLTSSLAYALQTSRGSDWRLLVGAFAFTTAYGVGIELLQLTLAYRTFDVGDALVNVGGAALAVTGWYLLVRRVRFYRCRRVAALRPPVE